MPATTTQLYSLLQALATGEATNAIEEQYEANYPASYDWDTDLLIQPEDN
jgi:hypothetical protein